jgi:hypothetical protein
VLYGGSGNLSFQSFARLTYLLHYDTVQMSSLINGNTTSATVVVVADEVTAAPRDSLGTPGVGHFDFRELFDGRREGLSRATAAIVFAEVARLGWIIPCENPTVVGGMARADFFIPTRAPDVMRGGPILLNRPIDGLFLRR